MDREALLERKAALLASQGWEPMRLARTPVGTCVITSEPFVIMGQIMIRVEKRGGKKPESFMFRALRLWPFVLSLATIRIEVSAAAVKDSPIRARALTDLAFPVPHWVRNVNKTSVPAMLSLYLLIKIKS